MAANNQLMKHLNLSVIRRTMREMKTATKPQLARETGINVVTVTSLMAELEKAGEVIPDGQVPSGGGRPSACYRYNENFCYAAVIYTYMQENNRMIQIRVLNRFGESVWKDCRLSEEVVVETFDELLEEAFAKYPSIRVIAFGLPGEAVDGRVIISDYEDLLGTRFLQYYEDRYRVPVLFENDINAMVFGHYHLDPRKEEALAGIYLPRIFPPGAGLLFDGAIHYGSSHFAGEISLLPVPIAWDRLDYQDEDAVVRQLSALLRSFCCIAAPSCMILYGDFLTNAIQEKLEKDLREAFGDLIQVRLVCSDDMITDYGYGMGKLAMEFLDKEEREDM